jgi:type IV pilus assembly protein PilB
MEYFALLRYNKQNMTIQFDEDKQNQKIKTLLGQEEEDLALMLSEKYGLHYTDLSVAVIDTDALRLLPETEAREAGIAVFGAIGKKLNVAIISPNAEETKLALKGLEDRKYILTVYMVSKASLEKAWSRYKDLSFAMETKAGSIDVSNEEIANLLKEVRTIDDIRIKIQEVLSMKKSFKISRIVEIVMAGAIATGSSDIHVEPEEKSVRLRYRLDGVLQDILQIDHETHELFLSRIKLLSGMKLNLKSIAQDGRFSVRIYDADIEIRTSILPGAYAESIVMRILNPKNIQVPLDELGIPKKLFDIIMHEANKPNGMILTTGPTGSGKTTTLYSLLGKVQSTQVKVITIEDPIEYHLDGIVQTQTDSKRGYTFAAGLRAALRQDPDIIMVGEIRDAETAETAIQAAETGHLVFSTLHTNNAAGTFPRLIDLGVDPKLITSAVTLSLAQRLVRCVCQACKKEVDIPEDYKALITEIVEGIYDPADKVPVGKIFEAVGCEKCNGTGYKGRVGLYEGIKTNSEIENLLRENPSERDIKKIAHSQGIPTLREYGVIQLLQGKTTLSELERVVDLREA